MTINPSYHLSPPIVSYLDFLKDRFSSCALSALSKMPVFDARRDMTISGGMFIDVGGNVYVNVDGNRGEHGPSSRNYCSLSNLITMQSVCS